VASTSLGGIALGRGQGTIRKGRAHTREARGIFTNSITHTHLSLLAPTSLQRLVYAEDEWLKSSREIA
jgi:hypothetical protein